MRELWDGLRPASASETAWAELYLELESRYSEPHRAYHNLEHIAEMTSLLATDRARMIDPFAVFMAAFFHDAILESGAKTNEKRSAELAAAKLAPFVDAKVTQRIAAMIVATEAHSPDPTDADLLLLIDADLAILGATPERFRAYDAGIRAEYGHVPSFFYRRGRKKFLAGMAARPSLFHDPVMKSRFEAAARKNLAAALAEDV